MLPGEDGLSILRRLQCCSDPTPVIMLTPRARCRSHRPAWRSGADDYLPKPFNPRELLARLHASCAAVVPMKRLGRRAGTADGQLREFVLDLSTRELTRNGEPVPITTGEFAVMKAFARHPRVPLSREKLMEMARGREYEAFDRASTCRSRGCQLNRGGSGEANTSRRSGPWLCLHSRRPELRPVCCGSTFVTAAADRQLAP